MKNILLIIPENTGTIASVSFDLYLGLKKQNDITVYVACLGPYSDSGFQFDNVFKLEGNRKDPFGKIFSRIIKLRNIKKKYAIGESISTLLGATYWNVLSGIGEYKIGIYHTRLEQMKYGGRFFYICNFIAEKTLCARLNKMIAVNKSAYLDLKRLHKHKKNIELVYNIHDFKKIKRLSLETITDEFEKQIFRHPVILYVGSLYCNIKGSDRLLRSFAKIKSSFQDYHLVYVGPDLNHSLEELQSLCKKYNLSDSVFFLGRKNNPYPYMKHAEILVSPSRDEGLPGVLIEALSLGLKCVATNSSMGVWEIMECVDEYDAELKNIVQTNYGFICPNNLENDDFTIQNLSNAIEKCISTNFPKMDNFDTSRFSENIIIPHFLELN